MSRPDVLRALEGELGLASDSLNENQALAGLEGWDSMAAVQFIALANEMAGITLSGHQVTSARTNDDLLALLNGARPLS